MAASDLLRRLGSILDGHRFDELPELLHPAFRATYVHTGEVFDVASFTAVNADYPGFERFTWVDIVDAGDRAVGRGHVTARTGDRVENYAVASFATSRDGRLVELVELWTDVDTAAPTERRPSR